MKTSHLATLGLALLAAFGSTTAARADSNLLADGDFENFAAQVASGSYTMVGIGSLGAWTVSGQSVDLIRNAYGSISNVGIDLAGTPGPGTLSQSFMAVAGTTYTLSWDYFKNGVGTPLDVGFGGSTTSYAPPDNITHASLTWTALANGLQTVSFGTASLGYQGPTLDNVALIASPVPEPASASVLLAGLACIGWLSKRRR